MANNDNPIPMPLENVFMPGNDTFFKSRHKTIEITEEEFQEIQETQNVQVVEEDQEQEEIQEQEDE